MHLLPHYSYNGAGRQRQENCQKLMGQLAWRTQHSSRNKGDTALTMYLLTTYQKSHAFHYYANLARVHEELSVVSCGYIYSISLVLSCSGISPCHRVHVRSLTAKASYHYTLFKRKRCYATVYFHLFLIE